MRDEHRTLNFAAVQVTTASNTTSLCTKMNPYAYIAHGTNDRRVVFRSCGIGKSNEHLQNVHTFSVRLCVMLGFFIAVPVFP